MHPHLRRRGGYGVQTRGRLHIQVRPSLQPSLPVVILFCLSLFRPPKPFDLQMCPRGSLLTDDDCDPRSSPREPDLEVVKRLIALPGTARHCAWPRRGVPLRIRADGARAGGIQATVFGSAARLAAEAAAIGSKYPRGRWATPARSRRAFRFWGARGASASLKRVRK